MAPSRWVAAGLGAIMLVGCAEENLPDAPARAASPEASRQSIGGSFEPGLINVGDRVFFEYGSSILGDQSIRTLQRQAAYARTYPNIVFTVEGHADERGTREYNLALGGRRAAAVRTYLIALGINGSRLRTVSYGKERPVVLGNNEAAWAQNRRAVSVVGP